MSAQAEMSDRDDTVPTALPSGHATLLKALATARDQLLDRSLRNKLIHTNLANTRGRQIRVVDELADEVFALLRDGKTMTFAPGKGKGDAEELSEEGPLSVEGHDGVWTPPEDDAVDERGVAARHRDNRLQTRMTAEGLQKKLTSLFYESEAIEEEQGVNVLFLAVGFLKWREARASDIDRTAPLVLLPVELQRDGRNDRFKLKLRPDDLYTNVSLQAWLREQFGIDLPEIPEADEWRPAEYFDQVQAAIAAHKTWSIARDEILLGFFSFSKFLLWRDLDPANWPKAEMLTSHSLLDRILVRRDDEDEGGAFEASLIGEHERIDEIFPPARLLHVTDADSSQAVAIQEALSGKNLVIQGPPGTGKSQTITNIIAGAVHAGKRVLFVAEKMAALEVVRERLEKQRLAPICLELHSRKASKTQVLEQIRQGMTAPAPPKWPDGAFSELAQTQTQLRRYADQMHAAEAGDFSAYEIIGRISLLKARGALAPTFSLDVAKGWSKDKVAEVEARAEALDRRLALAGIPSEHPWRGAGIAAPNVLEQERLKPTVDAVCDASEQLNRAVDQARAILGLEAHVFIGVLDVWRAALNHLSRRPAGLDTLLQDRRLDTEQAWLAEVIAVGRAVARHRDAVGASVRAEAWAEDWAPARREIAKHGRSIFRLFSSTYRNAVGDLRGVWNGALPKSHDQRLAVLDALIDGAKAEAALTAAGAKAQDLLGPVWRGDQTDWDALTTALDWVKGAREFEPAIDLRKAGRLLRASDAAGASETLEGAKARAVAVFETLQALLKLDVDVAFEGRTVNDLTPLNFAVHTRRWQERFTDITVWPPLREDLAWLLEIGGKPLHDQVNSGQIPAGAAASAILLALFEAKWNAVAAKSPDLSRTHGDDLDETVRRFRKADIDRIRTASDQVARAHIDQRPTGSAGAVGLLQEETKKARRLRPVRKLMKEAGEAVQRFKPVFLMSPLSVAQFLEPGVVEFDMIVIDEASQVRPEDALGAIARCRQVVVVGDEKQLPPTSFFSRMVNDGDDDEDEEDDAEQGAQTRAVRDVESILSLCSTAYPQTMLEWHYRSEHPALIATSNRAFYENRLKLPPSVLANAGDGTTGLVFHRVKDGGYERGRTARNEIEAEEVAQAVLRHVEAHPGVSLGIGAFSVAQRDCIRDRIDALARRHPQLDDLLKPANGREPLFVKNLENIQGDERDVIFISVGYGRDRDGRLVQNFGPVGREGGERRLNVLITRARKRCEVFSSIVAEDIRIDGPGKPGVVAFREFLKLAKDGYADIASATGKDFDSDFEEAVAEAIRGLGMTCDPQVGMAGFFIDIGVRDPRNPNHYLLGIECDGAAYHSSRYARDRDRLRQQILENRGWKIHRVWSTDWFYRRDREVEKLKAAIERALKGGTLPNAEQAYEPDFYDSEPDGVAEAPAPYTDAEPQSEAPPNGRLEPYVFAVFHSALDYAEPHQLSATQLAEIVRKIVQIEQPIHTEEVGRRVAALADRQRAGPRIQAAAELGLQAAKRSGWVTANGEFWTLASAAQLSARDRSQLASAEMVRKPQMICPRELRSAAVVALEENIALAPEELLVEAARLLGFNRTGKDIAAALEAAVSAREFTDKVTTDGSGRMRLFSR